MRQKCLFLTQNLFFQILWPKSNPGDANPYYMFDGLQIMDGVKEKLVYGDASASKK